MAYYRYRDYVNNTKKYNTLIEADLNVILLHSLGDFISFEHVFVCCCPTGSLT